MMAKFALVALLPESLPGRLDFVSREIESIDDIAQIVAELEEKAPSWRVVSFVHIEDLPLLMEDPIEPPTNAD